VRNSKHHSKNTVYRLYQEKCNLITNETAQIPDSDSMHCYITLVGYGKREQKVLITQAYLFYLVQDSSVFLTCNPQDKETNDMRSYNCEDK